MGQNATPNKTYGTVDGRPIPDRVFTEYRASATDQFKDSHKREPATAADEQEIEATVQNSLCGRLRAAITQMVRQEQADTFGVVATAQELEKERQRTQMPNPRRIRDHAEAAVAAFAAIDKGDDPKKVYEQMVKPRGIDEIEWNIYLKSRTTEAGRARIRMELTMTDENWAKFSAAQTDALKYAARSRKLDAVVDDQIASTDPTFRQCLYEFREKGNDPDPQRRWMPVDHKEYLDEARARWWKDRMGQVKVALSDPSLAQRCALGEMD